MRNVTVDVTTPDSPGVPVSLQVNLEQPEERMLRQKQSHTQGEKLPALKNNISRSPDKLHTSQKQASKRAGSLRERRGFTGRTTRAAAVSVRRGRQPAGVLRGRAAASCGSV